MIDERAVDRGSPTGRASQPVYGSSITCAGVASPPEAVHSVHCSTGTRAASVNTGIRAMRSSNARSSSRTRVGGSGQPAMTTPPTGRPLAAADSSASSAGPAIPSPARTARTSGRPSSRAKSRLL